MYSSVLASSGASKEKGNISKTGADMVAPPAIIQLLSSEGIG